MRINQEAIMTRKVDITAFQEHKLNDGAKVRAVNDFKKNGYQFECGPCNNSGNKPSAGVGIRLLMAISS